MAKKKAKKVKPIIIRGTGSKSDQKAARKVCGSDDATQKKRGIRPPGRKSN